MPDTRGGSECVCKVGRYLVEIRQIVGLERIRLVKQRFKSMKLGNSFRNLSKPISCFVGNGIRCEALLDEEINQAPDAVGT